MLTVLLRRPARFALILFAILPAGCADFSFGPKPNEFIGAWSTSDRNTVLFNEDTLVLSTPNGQPTPVSAAECNGRFGLRYGRMTRESLTGIAAAQPDVGKKLADMLANPVYPVAELSCDRGISTYVMLDDSDIVAIYRDRDVVGLDRMTRR